MSEYQRAKEQLIKLSAKLEKLSSLEDIEYVDINRTFQELKEFNSMYDSLRYGYELRQVAGIFSNFLKAIHHYMLLHGNLNGKSMTELHNYAYQTIVNMVRSMHRPAGRIAVTSSLPRDIFQGIIFDTEGEDLVPEESTDLPEYDPELLKEKKSITDFREELMKQINDTDQFRIALEKLERESTERKHVIFSVLSAPPEGKEVTLAENYIIIRNVEEEKSKSDSIITFRVKKSGENS